VIGEFPSYGANQDNWTVRPDLSNTFNPKGISGTSTIWNKTNIYTCITNF